MSACLPDIDRHYEEFRRKALREIAERIEQVQMFREQTEKDLASARKRAQELPSQLAKYDAELAHLRALTVAQEPPLLVGERKGGTLTISVPPTARNNDVIEAINKLAPPCVPVVVADQIEPAPLTGTPDQMGQPKDAR